MSDRTLAEIKTDYTRLRNAGWRHAMSVTMAEMNMILGMLGDTARYREERDRLRSELEKVKLGR